MSRHILLIDDDELMRHSVALYLNQSGFLVSTAASAEDALSLTHWDLPDLILLNISLPGMDGLDVLRQFQKQADTPIIFVIVQRSELDQILGLELDVDGYITKPFKFKVLLTHIKAVFHRAERLTRFAPEPKLLQVGDLIIDSAAHTVTMAGKPIELQPREFDVLHTLALEAGHVVSVDDLLFRVWGVKYSGESRAVYVYIRWLQEKMETDPKHPRRVLNVHGIGYKLEPQGV